MELLEVKYRVVLEDNFKGILNRMKPNYTKIYKDLIAYRKLYDRMTPAIADRINNIKTAKDILDIENYLFGNMTGENEQNINQQLKSYDEESIREILNDQKKNNLNNTQLAIKHNLSRNTVTRWKKVYSNIK
jgi:hypothetical protein